MSDPTRHPPDGEADGASVVAFDDASMAAVGAEARNKFLDALRSRDEEGASLALMREMSDEFYGRMPKAYIPSREVEPHVVLGADCDAKDWEFISRGGLGRDGGSAARPHFGLVVNACGTVNAPNYYASHPSISYFAKDLEDHVEQVLTADDLDEFADTIARAVFSGKNVFVHCLEGKSRSATALMAWMGKYHGMEYDDALRDLRAQRKNGADPFEVGPNAGFERVLRPYMHRYASGESVAPDSAVLLASEESAPSESAPSEYAPSESSSASVFASEELVVDDDVVSSASGVSEVSQQSTWGALQPKLLALTMKWTAEGQAELEKAAAQMRDEGKGVDATWRRFEGVLKGMETTHRTGRKHWVIVRKVRAADYAANVDYVEAKATELRIGSAKFPYDFEYVGPVAAAHADDVPRAQCIERVCFAMSMRAVQAPDLPPVGLVRKGNTCFILVLVQSLLACPPTRAFLEALHGTAEFSRHRGLVHMRALSHRVSLSDEAMTELIHWFHPEPEVEQEDPTFFLTKLLQDEQWPLRPLFYETLEYKCAFESCDQTSSQVGSVYRTDQGEATSPRCQYHGPTMSRVPHGRVAPLATVLLPPSNKLRPKLGLDDSLILYACLVRHYAETEREEGIARSGGHYMCYVRRSGTWYFIDDNKVREEEPPSKLGRNYAYVQAYYTRTPYPARGLQKQQGGAARGGAGGAGGADGAGDDGEFPALGS